MRSKHGTEIMRYLYEVISYVY